MSAGHLLYTSAAAARPGGSGGWQVTEEQGLSPEERDRALDLVATTLDVPEPPRFPSPAEVDALPRRLLVERGPQGSLVLVHSTLAGPDATGRPGNVFNRVVVVRAEELARAQIQPLQLWRSPDWSSPWGPDAVRRPVPAAGAVPRPGSVMTRRAVARRLAAVGGAGPAPEGLAQLVDAVGAALGGGPPVLVLVDDQEGAVLTLACAVLPIGPAVGPRLTLSTWERAAGLRRRGDLPMVSLVPRQDADALDGISAVVVDPAAGGPPPGGSPAGPSLWSTLASCLWGRSEPVVLERLEAVHDLAGLNPPAARADLLWPLAVAVAESGLDRAKAAPEVLIRVGTDLLDEDTTEDVRGLLQKELGASPAEAAEALTRLGQLPKVDEGLVAELLQTYLRRVLVQERLLADPWPPPLPDLDVPASAHATLLGEFRTFFSGRPPVEPDGSAVLALRGLDLAQFLGLPGEDGPLHDAVFHAVMLLLGKDRTEVLRRALPLAPRTVQRLVPYFVRGLRTVAALPQDVRSWLQEAGALSAVEGGGSPPPPASPPPAAQPVADLPPRALSSPGGPAVDPRDPFSPALDGRASPPPVPEPLTGPPVHALPEDVREPGEVQAATGAAELFGEVVYGLRAVQDCSEPDPKVVAELLVAAVLVLARSTSHPGVELPPMEGARLRSVSGRLSELVELVGDLGPVLDGVVQAAEQDPTVLPALFASVARAQARYGTPPERRQAEAGDALWRAELRHEQKQIGGRTTLGDALLHHAFKAQRTPVPWVQEQLNRLVPGLGARKVEQLRSWAFSLRQRQLQKAGDTLLADGERWTPSLPGSRF